MDIKKHIPNTITLGNLCCGIIAIMLAAQWKFQYAAMLVLAASVFDFFDGFAARMLHVKSDIGKELDSLSDVVSFGVAPAMIMYYVLYKEALFAGLSLYAVCGINVIPAICGIVYACCVALRLGKFNVDTRQGEVFLGLPSPAAAFVLVSLPFFADTKHSFIIYIALMLLMCAAMLTEYPLMSLKFHDFSFKKNMARYVLIVCSVALIIALWFKAIIPIMLIYVILSIIDNHKTSKE